MERTQDIQPLTTAALTITINGHAIPAAEGETVLGVLAAVAIQDIGCNDAGQVMGAYCGMGVCHCCLVRIDGLHKRRACQTQVRDGMQVDTLSNRLWEDC